MNFLLIIILLILVALSVLIILGLIKKIFIRLLTGILSACNHTKCMLLSNQKCMIQPTLINLHPSECSQTFHCYPFTVKLDKCIESYNTLHVLSNKVFVPNKIEDLNLSVLTWLPE